MQAFEFFRVKPYMNSSEPPKVPYCILYNVNKAIIMAHLKIYPVHVISTYISQLIHIATEQ